MTKQTQSSRISKIVSIAFGAAATVIVLTAVSSNSVEAGPRYPFGIMGVFGMDLGSGR